MKITVLVENTSKYENIESAHGLSIYIEIEHHKILFDLGPDETFIRNAQKLGINLGEVDTVIISHGHYDHGGGLKAFLALNHRAKIYIHRNAFLPHYSKSKGMAVSCGLDPSFKKHPQIIFSDTEEPFFAVDHNILLFSNPEGTRCIPTMNQFLYEKRGRKKLQDDFTHEQNLIITENGKTFLFAGCAHRGIINIIRQAIVITGKSLDYVFSGFHLTSHSLNRTEDTDFLNRLVYHLMKYSSEYYTFHCTGIPAYEYLASFMERRMHYLSAGDSIDLSEKGCSC